MPPSGPTCGRRAPRRIGACIAPARTRSSRSSCPQSHKEAVVRRIDCSLLGLTFAAVWGLGFHATTSDCNGVSRCYGWSAFAITILVVLIGAVATLLYDSIGLAYLGANHRQGRVGTAGYATRRSRPQWSQCLVRAIAFWLSVPVSGVAIYVIYNVLNIGSSHETWKFLAVVLSPSALPA